MAVALEDMEQTPNGLVRWGLMHDAAEAYLGDMVRPLKRSMPEYRKAEERLMRVIADQFGLSWPMPSEILDIDLVLLVIEQRDLMGKPPKPWASVAGIEPLIGTIIPMPSGDAEHVFLAQFERLFGT